MRTDAPPRRRRRVARHLRGRVTGLLVDLLIGLLIGLALACRREAVEPGDDDKPAPAAVTCRPAAAATIEDTVEVTGVIAPPPKLDAIVSSPIAGRVGQVSVEEGDRVAAGALLAVIEDPALPAGTIE